MYIYLSIYLFIYLLYIIPWELLKEAGPCKTCVEPGPSPALCERMQEFGCAKLYVKSCVRDESYEYNKRKDRKHRGNFECEFGVREKADVKGCLL